MNETRREKNSNAMYNKTSPTCFVMYLTMNNQTMQILNERSADWIWIFFIFYYQIETENEFKIVTKLI